MIRDAGSTIAHKIAGYVLAGGGSTRFGSDKALAEFAGKPMLARIIELMRGVTKEVKVVAAPGKYAEFGAKVVEDRWPGEGPLGGIVTALLHTQNTEPGCVWNLILSCDLPFLTADWMTFLAKRAAESSAQVVLPHSSQGPEPLCAVWQTDARAAIEDQFEKGVRKVTAAIGKLKSEVLDEQDWKRFDSAGRLFWNMNTAADFEEARRIVQAEQR
ncbi:MAG TPA: molybdenum cofactor guanylyltransferase [Candidatus Acidoferrum sp.]|nr:molybdenum cofactor guanylyltransferase [Candidatus Acidoferrum sp.]